LLSFENCASRNWTGPQVRLEATKAPAEVIVIDQVEKPGENQSPMKGKRAHPKAATKSEQMALAPPAPGLMKGG
jgi:hypothetical protein